MNSMTKGQSNMGGYIPFIKGVGLTFLIAIIAKFLSSLPFLSIMGQLVIAILIGMVWSATIGVRENLQDGVSFSSKKLLRLGIILLGMRLNLADIYYAGLGVFTIALINVIFALIVVYGLTRLFGVDKKISILTACGTAICGAAAVVAIAPQIKAKVNETATAVAIVALLGTIFTFSYTLLYSNLNLSSIGYGVFAGGTLHEIAHVVAAAAPGGNVAVDMAIIVKLTRVALLVPVALIIGLIVQKDGQAGTKNKFSISIFPWFILGFIIISGVNSLGVIPETAANHIVNIAYLFLGMAMAGLGLNVETKTFRKNGAKPFVAGAIGSVLLSVLGYALVFLFQLN